MLPSSCLTISLSPKRRSPNRHACGSVIDPPFVLHPAACVFIIFIGLISGCCNPVRSVRYSEFMSIQRLQSNSERNLSQNFRLYLPLPFTQLKAIHLVTFPRLAKFSHRRFKTLNIILSQLLFTWLSTITGNLRPIFQGLASRIFDLTCRKQIQ